MLMIVAALASLQAAPEAPAAKARSSWDATGGFVGVRVSSLPASIAWYRDALGFEMVAHNEQYSFAILRRGSSLVELSGGGVRAAAPAGATPPTGPNKFGLVVTDFDALQAQLEQRKIRSLGRIIRSDADGMRTLAIEDPDGNLIQFFGR